MLQKLRNMLRVEICDIRVSISYFGPMLVQRGSQIRQIMALKLFVGTKFRENSQKSQKLRILLALRYVMLFLSKFHKEERQTIILPYP